MWPSAADAEASKFTAVDVLGELGSNVKLALTKKLGVVPIAGAPDELPPVDNVIRV
jgi:hypothetical protein